MLSLANEPEYRGRQNNKFMEALRDRTVKTGPKRVKGKHIALDTIEVAATWAVLPGWYNAGG